MGFDKLTAPFAGEPLARRAARALAELEPLFVTTSQVADAISDLHGEKKLAWDRGVRAFIAAVPDDADLAWPRVGETPGHPVVWSPKARARIPAQRGVAANAQRR